MPKKRTNPLEMARETHYLAREHLRRFAPPGGCASVYVYNLRDGSTKLLPVDVGGKFSVRDMWSHSAESRMTDMEGAFWEALDRELVPGRASEQDVIVEYYCMWYARSEYARRHAEFVRPLANVAAMNLKETRQFPMPRGVVDATIEDILEFRGASFYSTDLSASARSSSWVILRTWMDQVHQALRARKLVWHFVESRERRLILPDRVCIPVIPVAPQVLLVGAEEGRDMPLRIGRKEVDILNRDLLASAFRDIAAYNKRDLERLLSRRRRR